MTSQWTVQRFFDEIVPSAVLPAIATLLTPSERASVKIRIVDWEGADVSGETPIGENELMLEVTVLGEACGQYLFAPESVEEFERRFYNGLQDFISESTFGWGQLRGPVLPLSLDES
ncbi:hypothetical protein [Frondihabitans sp. Leaf304]|uniref:hypothetical protein n=1 Tax=Frondihabitans sp. Leaf304 TaxID=1736329 RepID=UPI0006FC3A70|nr:hypothetical protein [Frondihabitans sp. Leaf304]KQQ27954.1 hypothetical protein ASF54_04280 [Frondihabitans sp. Leaf304]